MKLSTLLKERKKNLSLAESMTGGSLAYSFVKESGSSEYFLGSIVAYNNAAKNNLLNVSLKTLELFGSVSLEVATEMAQGALQKFHSDFACAVTGFAGPDGEDVGKVAVAIAAKNNETLSWISYFKGDRIAIIEQSVESIQMRLYEYVRTTR